MNLQHELRTYLDTQVITGDNIGEIRGRLCVPWDSAWNGIVRDETARRERRIIGQVSIRLTGREMAILACVLRRCESCDDPRELERFLCTAADQVRGGFSDDEMIALGEKLAGTWADRCR